MNATVQLVSNVKKPPLYRNNLNIHLLKPRSTVRYVLLSQDPLPDCLRLNRRTFTKQTPKKSLLETFRILVPYQAPVLLSRRIILLRLRLHIAISTCRI